MENPDQNRTDHDRATPEQFATWLRSQLTKRGYDVKRPRGGGQSRFAADSGIGRATVSRILAGQGATETRVLEALATALGVPLPDVLVAAGVLSSADLARVRAPRTDTPMTPEEAADELGITDPLARQLFVAQTNTLRSAQSHNGGRAAEN
ncbi:helix-turn-helix domain-containing protein [Streptomyces sp. NPDC003860]